MKTTNFQLPKTASCIVVWYRNGVKNETLITTPETNSGLVNTMFMTYRVGPSEIRAVKGVNPKDLASAMMGV